MPCTQKSRVSSPLSIHSVCPGVLSIPRHCMYNVINPHRVHIFFNAEQIIQIFT